MIVTRSLQNRASAAAKQALPKVKADKSRPTTRSDLKQQLNERDEIIQGLREQLSNESNTALHRLRVANTDLRALRAELGDQLKALESRIESLYGDGPRKFGKHKKGDTVFCAACGQTLLPQTAAKHRILECPVIQWKRFQGPDNGMRAKSQVLTSDAPNPASEPTSEPTSKSLSKPVPRLASSSASTEQSLEKTEVPQAVINKRTCRYCLKIFDNIRKMRAWKSAHHCTPSKPCSPNPEKKGSPILSPSHYLEAEEDVVQKQKGDGADGIEEVELKSKVREVRVELEIEGAKELKHEVKELKQRPEGEAGDLIESWNLSVEAEVKTETVEEKETVDEMRKWMSQF